MNNHLRQQQKRASRQRLNMTTLQLPRDLKDYIQFIQEKMGFDYQYEALEEIINQHRQANQELNDCFFTWPSHKRDVIK